MPISTGSRTTSWAGADSPAGPPTSTAATTPPPTGRSARCGPSTCCPASSNPATPPTPTAGPLLMFSNDDCRILLSRRHEPMPFYARHVDGDLLCFVHQGAGLLETEFGPLRYREGDWVYIPKACTWRQVPDSETTLLMIEASDEFRVPPPGALGRHFPFDPSQATIPEPAPIEDDGRDEYEVRLIHEGGPTTLYYQHNPLDVEGWRGDNFAFTFNIADYNVITSDSVHLPPTVHLFMQATGVYVMNFLPKPAEGVPGTERTPWYHRNVDYDEIAFFHGGSLYGIPMPPGLISHAPQGVHHGAPEKARERARRKFDELFPRRLAGHRRRHPPATDTVGRSTRTRPGAALMMTSRQARIRPNPLSRCLPEQFRRPRCLRRAGRDHRAGKLSAQAERQAVGHRAGVHAPDRRRRVPADDQRAGPRRPSRHLLQQPVPRHGFGAADGEGGRGSRRVHQGRQKPAGLRQGGAGRVEWRRFAVGVLPAAGPARDDHVQPVRRRPRPDRSWT